MKRAMVADNRLDDALNIARAAAYEAGHYLLSKRGQAQVRGKKTAHDDLLDVNLESEAILLTRLRAAFPTHSILSEEAGHLSAEKLYQWIVDPLDGSGNFQHGSAVLGVGVGL